MAQNLVQELARAQPQIAFTRSPADEQSIKLPETDYRLDSGDQIAVYIWNPRLNLNYDLTVNLQGEILVPRMGFIQSKGLTISQIEQAILQSARLLQKDSVQVRVVLRQIRKIRVLISGYVQRPGYYQVYWGTPLLELIRKAGGVRDNGSVRQIRWKHAQKNDVIDLFAFHFFGQTQANPFVIEDSEIFVPALEQRVAVLGEVQQPGLYEIRESDRSQDLLKWAGGLKATADPAGLQIWQQGLDRVSTVSLNQAETMSLIGEQANVKLQNGDIIYAGARKLQLNEQHILIQGQIRQPGSIVWRQGLRLLDVLEQVGGALPTADLDNIRLSRQEQAQRKEQIIHLQSYLNGQNDLEGNPEILADDVISVPESFWNIRNVTELTTLVLSTLGIVSVVINLSRGNGQ